MSAARSAGAVLLVFGLVAGSLAPTPAPPGPRRAGDLWILAVDFHVHGFPGDGALAPGLLRAEVARAGLDAFVLTNHNRVSTARAARRDAAGSAGPIVIVGQEVTARGFHVTAAGIEERVDWHTSAAETIRAIHAQHGVAIANHPDRTFRGWDDGAIAILDGYERAHPAMRWPEKDADFAAFGERALIRRPGIASIGSSDFHVGGSPGWCRTYVLAREPSAAGILDAVRAGRSVAVDMNGRLYGAPDTLAIVERAGGFVPPPDRPRAWERLSATASWLGLLGTILL